MKKISIPRFTMPPLPAPAATGNRFFLQRANRFMWKYAPPVIRFTGKQRFLDTAGRIDRFRKNMRNLKRNRFSFLLRGIWLASCRTIGGQAVMEGVMMRNSDVYGLAVRGPDGKFTPKSRPWRSLTRRAWSRCPLSGAFPFLLETMINGIKALNRSVEMSGGEEVPSSGLANGPRLPSSLAGAWAFVVAPHLLSPGHAGTGPWRRCGRPGIPIFGMALQVRHFTMGFHICLIPRLYPISRRVFEYHGAEHKTIHAYERSEKSGCGRSGPMSICIRARHNFLLLQSVFSLSCRPCLCLALAAWTPEARWPSMS